MKTFQLTSLKGIDDATPDGLSDAPKDLLRLKPFRGGYTVFNDTLATLVSFGSNRAALVGYDPLGLASLMGGNSPNNPTLFDGVAISSVAGDSAGYPYHVPGAGYFDEKGKYIVKTRSGGFLNQGSALGSVAKTFSTTGGALSKDTAYFPLWLTYILTPGGKTLIALGGGAEIIPGGVEPNEYTVTYTLTSPAANVIHEVYIVSGGVAYLAGALTPDKTSITVSELPIGAVLPLHEGTAAIARAAFRGGIATIYKNRVWGVPNTEASAFAIGPDPMKEVFANLQKGLIYSELGTTNLMLANNYLANLLPGSSQITGLVGTDEGLLVFGENDCVRVYGDPALAGSRVENFGVEPYPVVVGHDPRGAFFDGFWMPPARLGNTVFTVWRGEVYAVGGGQARNLSEGLAVSFRQVVAEALSEQIVAFGDDAATASVYRYDLKSGAWFRGQGLTAGYSRLLPGPIGKPIRYHAFPFSGSGSISSVGETGTPSAAIYQSPALDMGDPHAVKSLHRIELPYTGDATGISAEMTVTPDADTLSAFSVTGVLRHESFVFHMPRGKTFRTLTFSVTFSRAGLALTLRAPFTVFYTDRYRRY